MTLLLRHQVLLVLIAAIIFLTNLGGHALFNDDEARTAASSAEMHRNGIWLVPTFNEQLNSETPIGIHWVMLTAFRMFMISEFSARLAPALFAVATVILTYHLGRKLYSSEVGFLAGIILCTCLLFAGAGRAATADSMVTCLITLSMTSYTWIVTRRKGSSFTRKIVPPHHIVAAADDDDDDEDDEEVERVAEVESSPTDNVGQFAYMAVLFALFVFAPLGLVMLTSGPVAVILQMVTLLSFVLASIRYDDLKRGKLKPLTGSNWQNAFGWLKQAFRLPKLFRACLEIHLIVGIIVVAAIALPWYFAVSSRTHGVWPREFLWGKSLGSIFSARSGQSGYPLFYAYDLVITHLGYFPWSVFLPVAVFRLWERLHFGASWRESDRLLSCWVGVWFFFFSFSLTKQPMSLVPIYPALALILGRYFVDWKREEEGSSFYSFDLCCKAMWISGIVISLLVNIYAYLYFSSEQWVAAIPFIPVIGGFVAAKLLDLERRPAVVQTLIWTALSFTILFVDVAPGQLRHHQDSPIFIAEAHKFADSPDVAIATYEYFEPSVVYYAERPVPLLKSPHEVVEFIGSNPRAFVIVKKNRFTDNELKAVFINGVIDLSRHKHFLHAGELGLVGRTLRGSPMPVLPNQK